jgi:uncharacterized membrane protein YdbT with pleckstrin-like domain
MGYLDSLMGKNEEIVLVTRKHWITIIGAVIVNGILFLVLMAIGSALVGMQLVTGPMAWLPLLIAILIALWPLARLVRELLHWWNDYYVVTNRRIVQLQGVINKQTIDSSLDKINDVVLTQSALGRMLGYGDLEILTASEIGVNKLTRIANAIHFKTEMLDQKEGMRELDGG